MTGSAPLPRARSTHQIKGHGDVTLTVAEYGKADGPALLLIHGWSQHHLSWARQLSGPLADRFRLIAPDLRGHGASDKPDDASAYDTSAPWAGDIAAIIDQLGLDQPILVGWSMGGWVVQDYLRLHGDTNIGGIVLVGTSLTTGQKAPPKAFDIRRADSAATAAGMFSTDQAENLTATLAFVQACSLQPVEPADLAIMCGFNMLAPPHIRVACRMRSEDYRPIWDKVTKPVMLVWGEQDRLAVAPMVQEAIQVLPQAEQLAFAECGHMPFWEHTDAFNDGLMRFADRALGNITPIEGTS